MTDAQIIAGMRSRLIQLQQIASLAHSEEIRAMVLKVAGEIQAEIDRLGTAEPDVKIPMPPQA